jgi:hypothetical protein
MATSAPYRLYEARMTAETIARSLQAKKVSGGWMARCPAHDDKNPSLSITERDGIVLVHCLAGCSQEAVIDKLRSLGLWESKKSKWIKSRDGILYYHSDWGKPVQDYLYTDAHGEYLYSIWRFDPKDFRQGYYPTKSQWIWKKHPHQVLYRLPEVIKANKVYLVEGEKDADTLHARGYTATTAASGADAPWLPQFTDALRGKDITVIADNDPPGWRRALDVARALIGAAASLQVCSAADGAKDVSDWYGNRQP